MGLTRELIANILAVSEESNLRLLEQKKIILIISAFTAKGA